MMLWRALSGRTICQAADAVAARRVAKTKKSAEARPEPVAEASHPKVAATILPGGTTRRSPGTV
jgi:hypothetical protein